LMLGGAVPVVCTKKKDGFYPNLLFGFYRA
jgi:hypothetical protein